MKLEPDDIVDKLVRNLKTDREKCSMICTTLGLAATLTQYIGEHCDLSKLPYDILYAMSLTAGNMIAITSDESYFGKIDYSDRVYPEISEQKKEHIYRKMKEVIGLLNETIKEIEGGI